MSEPLASAAASAVGPKLFARRTAKRISGAVMQVGVRIGLSAADRDRALCKLSHEVSREIRSLNHTLAAIAVCDNSSTARRYLLQIVKEGISTHDARARTDRLREQLDTI